MPTQQQLRGQTHSYSWADESAEWPAVQTPRPRPWAKLVAVALAVALVTGASLVAFAGGWLLGVW